MNRRDQTLGGILLLLAAASAIGGVRIWAGPCAAMLSLEQGGQTHMKCFYAGQAILLLALIMAIISITTLVLRQPTYLSGILAITTGMAIFLVLSNQALGIGICAKHTMACHAMASFERVSAILSIAAGAWLIFRSVRNRGVAK